MNLMKPEDMLMLTIHLTKEGKVYTDIDGQNVVVTGTRRTLLLGMLAQAKAAILQFTDENVP